MDVPPEALEGALDPVAAISAGGSHCLAVTEGGKVLAWGDDTFGQSSVPTNLTQVRAVAAGSQHSLALLADGSVVTWGTPRTYNVSRVPPEVLAGGVMAIASGEQHAVALLSEGGRVVAWGSNE
jgi:alpha-tubulin suppressor-like RCC1 family protein